MKVTRQVVYLVTLILLLLAATYTTTTMARTLSREADGTHVLGNFKRIGVAGKLNKHTLSVKQYQSLLNLHCHVITNGRVSNHILSTLSVTYALCGHIAYARKLFDVMPESSHVDRTKIEHRSFLFMDTNQSGDLVNQLNQTEDSPSVHEDHRPTSSTSPRAFFSLREGPDHHG
ncbi:Uncharacterized protein Rs2_03537 [Raphanus sativus]|nr:Uncharacterized protein Rs2_03537 [Raphanus sativus]